MIHLNQLDETALIPKASRDPGKKDKTTSIWSRMSAYFRSVGHRRISGVAHISDEVAEISKLCLDHDSTERNYFVHRARAEGLRRLIHLEYDIPDGILIQVEVKDVIRCAASCYFYFQQEMQGAQGCKDFAKRREWEMADQLYEKIIQRIVFERPNLFIRAVSSYITDAQLWGDECMCLDALEKIVSQGVYGALFLEALIDEIDNMLLRFGTMQARQVVRVLFGLLTTYQWEAMKSAEEEAIFRFFENYHLSLRPATNAQINYVPLKKGFEVCARRLFENLENYDILKLLNLMCTWIYQLKPSEDNLVPELSSVIEYAASLHQTVLYEDTLTKPFFRLILKMIASDRRLVSLLGNRVLQQFLDRNGNLAQFDTPKIFFQETEYTIVSEEYLSVDKELLRAHRSYIHDSLLRSIVVHGMYKANIEAVYTTICLMLVEVQCGYTAASSVCLAMAIQDAALQTGDIDKVFRNHLHALVMSVMTLLCWIHKAKDFFKYVSGILKRRSDFAPHLNPPLSTMYNYAQHHVMWDKPDMFFENWEVRYGLWMHFRTGERLVRTPKASLSPEDAAAIAPALLAQIEADSDRPRRGFTAKNVQRSSLAQRKNTVMVPRKSTVSGDVGLIKKKGSMQSRKSTITATSPLLGKKANKIDEANKTIADDIAAATAAAATAATATAPEESTLKPATAKRKDKPKKSARVVTGDDTPIVTRPSSLTKIE